MAQNLFSSWINVLDESMMEWFNRWAPGFMCVSRKQYPFDNDQHTSCCALNTVLWISHIVKRKDRPTQLGLEKWEDLSRTIGIILRMCEPIFLTGKFVFLDSGFFVSKGITALLEFGVYSSVFVKKRKYWPKGVPGDSIDQYFSDKSVTYVDMLWV